MDNRFDLKPTPIAGMFTVRRQTRGDARGWFERLYCETDLATLGIDWRPRQINRSFTATRGTLRGLHFQHPPDADAKYITCLRGRVRDVAVDLRRGSPTFLKWHAVDLDAQGPDSVLLPTGVAHGFQTLTKDCELLYMHSRDYAPDAEGGLNALDPRLAIDWPLPVAQMSDRDRSFAPLTPDFDGVAP